MAFYVVGMKACGSSHDRARELAAVGHEVRLMPPPYVKPYVKRQKNEAADAEAICEAVTRPNSGLDGDAAVRSALTEPWSSGQAEGQINRLKLVKRQSYGRADLDLPQRRVVLAA